tara:strand:+ start:4541 stop:6058 length:1518 start_codon:yes stop_codon:yes gene_type:complete
MTFWIASIGLSLAVAALLTLAVLRPRGRDAQATAYDLEVYRAQLKEVDRDLARGVIAEAEADRVRTEISRRILAADSAAQTQGAERQGPAWATWGAVAVLAVAVVGGSLWLYRDLGAPGYGDLSLKRRVALAQEAREGRPDQAAAEASMPPAPPLVDVTDDYRQLIERLRATTAERAADAQGQALLAQHEANLGNYKAAYEAQQKLVELKGDEATAADHATLAGLMIRAAGGYVSPEAEAALRRTLTVDPQNGAARYYWGLMQLQTGRPDLAFRFWQELLQQSGPDAPWSAPIRAQIEEVAQRAGVNYTLPAPVMRDPSDENIAAASELSGEDRTAMVRGMVENLSQRLATEGGPPEQWAQLIRSLGVLGDTERATAILDEALTVFAGSPQAIDLIRAAALDAGLEEPPVRGPSAGDIDAASDLSVEARSAMIQGMVNNLSDRLSTEGGPPEQWAQLIRSLGVMGDTERAAAIRDEALAIFANDQPAIDQIRSAAQAAGLPEPTE